MIILKSLARLYKKHSNIRTFEHSNISHRGFTILELLVASLLLSMLVTMLTMIFNQSSIAWRTGVASVSELGETRKQMGGYHEILDDVLPGVGQQNASVGNSDNRSLQYRTVSLFKDWDGSGRLGDNLNTAVSGRLLDDVANEKNNARLGSAIPGSVNGNVMQGALVTGLDQPSNGRGNSGFIVGVRSAGPDGDMNTEEDNIDTFPEDVE